MTIAIIDDFKPDQVSIAGYVKQFLQQCGGSEPQFFFYSSGEAFIRALSPHFFDLVILDCCMDGMDGLQTAEEFRKMERDTALIFITSSPDYAIDGYLVDACGYLLKPFTYDMFYEVMEKALEKHFYRKNMIIVTDGRTKQWIAADDIIYCDIDGHYSQIHLCARRMVRIRMAFTQMLSLLDPYPQFLECYRGCIINMSHAVKVEDMNFLMDTGERVPYRKKERQKLMQKYSDYLFEKFGAERI